MGITVIPAYRVVARFIKEVQGETGDRALDLLEERVRTYVRHLLSGIPSSLLEVGERWALTQLGDPDLAALAHALESLETASPKGVTESALARCAAVLPRPDISARVLLLPGDGESRLLVGAMKGVMGLTLGAQAMLLFLWPTEGWREWLAYTVAHEYTHLVRNHLFPRGMVGGRLVYLKTQEPDTLLDALVGEGIADAFARDLFPHLAPPWVSALSSEEEGRVWPKVRRRLSLSDPGEIRRFLFGDGDRVPMWAGYTIGFRIVRGYLDRHPGARPASLVSLSAREVYEGSGYI